MGIVVVVVVGERDVDREVGSRPKGNLIKKTNNSIENKQRI